MTGLVKKLAIATSVAVGMTAIGSAPAFAGTLTNPQFGGTAASDYLSYCSNGSSTYAGPTCTDSLSTILSGNSSAPGGNIELAASSEQGGFDFTKNTALTGKIGGKDIVISSLTQSDWMSVLGNGKTLLSQWLDDAFLAHSISSEFKPFVQQAFLANNGMQRFSDPNISYVNQDNATGEISIGLAGHFNASNMLKEALGNHPLLSLFVPNEVKASELVKVIYDNGPAKFLYSFTATDALQANKHGVGADGVSHNGNYEVKLAGVPVTSVPEPSTMLALMAVGGLVATSKRKSAKNA
ncbi:NF038130 family PEP-CTERM protein [Oscillatoria acuminata]|uniref:PEP-CTERM putative exosortase interaction domain-containing protein n=1 Tax=Oscillatoria acuminata PCC 6304 TaxID=56110 RepID=K9TPA4_9CYAN|nr:NF038130 family PEP-CTERM protein [Oscillatoria acuminata]AFY84692.1 PEP-CTERM putative exosortase interaction domain-containing protein [Oscillatoria acuminata PCC 6304]